MPNLKITTPNAGGISLLSWLDLPSNVQPVEEIAGIIVPVQEQLPFQSRWFYLDAQLAAIGQNDAFQFDALCPEDEAWRIDYILVFHDSAQNLDFEVRVVHPASTGVANLDRVIHLATDENTTQMLYPIRNLQGTVSRNELYDYTEPLHILSEETLRIRTDVNPDVATITVSVTVRYQQIPPPIGRPVLSDVLPDVTTI